MKSIQDKYGVFWYNQEQICRWRQEDFDRKAAEFASAGINIVMTFSSTHFRWSFYPWRKEIVSALAKIVKACHRYGIRVVEHHSCHLTHNPRSKKEWNIVNNHLRTRRSALDMFPGLKEHIAGGDPEIAPGVFLSDCRQIDGRTGDFARTVYNGYGHCFNNPHFRKAYFDYLEEVYATGVDGIMTDDVAYFGSQNACTCRYCREKFKEETGHDLPLPADWGKFHGNFDDPVYIAWLRFRLRSTERFQRDVNAHFKSLGLDLLRPNYAAGAFGCNAVAYPFEEAGDLWSCVFQENMFSSVIRTAWPGWHSVAEHRKSMAKKYHVPAMSMFYPARFDDYYFCWSLARAWNQLLMASPEGGDLNGVEKQFASFDADHPVVTDASPLTDIGFFEPRSSLDLTPEPLKNIIWPMNVFLQGGMFAGLHFGILFENDPLEEFLKYPLVVLCGAVMLSDDELRLLKRYCEEGGHLLIFGPFGIRNPDGSRRAAPEKIFGLEAEIVSADALPEGVFSCGGRSVVLPSVEESFRFGSVTGDFETVASCGEAAVGISAFNGRVVWLAGGIRCRRPEHHYYDQRISRWTEHPGKMTFGIDAEDYLRRVPGAILRLLLGKKPRVQCGDGDHLVSAYSAAGRGIGIHLVNVSGVLPRKGEEFSHGDLFVNFLPGAEKNKDSVKIELAVSEKIGGAQAFSPEFSGAVSVPFRCEDGGVTLTVPAGTFSGYLNIQLTMGRPTSSK